MSDQTVRTVNLSWRELVQKSWGKEWNKSEVVYEFGDRKFNDPKPSDIYVPEANWDE